MIKYRNIYYYLIILMGIVISYHPLSMLTHLLFKIEFPVPDILKEAAFLMLPMTYIVLPILSILCFGFKEFKSSRGFGYIFLLFWFIALFVVFHIVFI